jgi:quercetin dioxygenase-like cupin family protein
MKRLILVLALAGAAVWAAVAVATPGQGQTNTLMSLGTLQGDVAFNTGIKADATGLSWQGREYSADRLPEFLMRLRGAGVTDLGAWLNLHPAVSAKFGLAPIGLLHSPEIATQTARFAPGAASGWHSHPGFLVSTVVSGELTRYSTDCSAETFGPGQSFYETGASTFIVKNETNKEAIDTVTFVVPGGTPTTGLRIDKPQPASCSK